jgi:peroxin-6
VAPVRRRTRSFAGRRCVQKQSASVIGAPKVPNVKWADVGGLEEVRRRAAL